MDWPGRCETGWWLMCWTREAMNGDVCEYGDTHEVEGAPLQQHEPTLTADWVQQAGPAKPRTGWA